MAQTWSGKVFGFTLLSLFFLLFIERLFAPKPRLRKMPVGKRILPNDHEPCNDIPSTFAFPAAAKDRSVFTHACDLTQGLSLGHRCDLKRGYTFFTFDPEQDEHVSHGMIETGGLYDAHVHVALDYALDELGQKQVSCATHNTIVLDIGSNLGTLALYASALGCRTHAFEIQPAVICRLEMSTVASNLDIRLHRNAVHSEAGKTFSFGSSLSNPGGVGIGRGVSPGEQPQEVESVRLDDVFFDTGDTILFMKIDTEGNEFEVLKSANKLLGRQMIKYMVVEVRPSQTDLVKFVYNHGYGCNLIRAARARSDIVCRKKELSQLLAELEAVEHFSDMFCCVIE